MLPAIRLVRPARPAVKTLKTHGYLCEIFLSSHRPAAGAGFALCGVEASAKPVLWVCDKATLRRTGHPFRHGLDNVAAGEPLFVRADNARDVLWAMEEGLKCPALGQVIGEIASDPRALDFVATRRLAMAAERSGVPCFLLRVDGAAGLSGARERWRIAPSPSLPHRYDTRAPGRAMLGAELFRSRYRQPTGWEVAHDEAGDCFDLVPAVGDGATPAVERAA